MTNQLWAGLGGIVAGVVLLLLPDVVRALRQWWGERHWRRHGAARRPYDWRDYP